MTESSTDASAETGTSRMGRSLPLVLRKLRMHYFLLILLLLVSLVFGLIIVIVVPPSYTATAVVGPASQTLDQLSNPLGGAVGGLASHIGLGALSALSGGGDTFTQYTEILTSNRIAAKLAQDQNVLRSIFYDRYDWDRHQWKSRDDMFHETIDYLKTLVHYPVKSMPDEDDVIKFLSSKLTVDSPLTTEFSTVTLEAKSPEEAQWLLSTILLDADVLIRSDKKRDVAARIDYLTQIIPTVTKTDESDALTSLLSMQEQSKMEIAADARYASDVVDTPHADLKPTLPTIGEVSFAMVLLAIGTWAAMVFRLPSGHWLLVRFSALPRWEIFRRRLALRAR